MNQPEDDEEDGFLPEVEDAETEAWLGDRTKSPLNIVPASLPVYMTIHRYVPGTLTSVLSLCL